MTGPNPTIEQIEAGCDAFHKMREEMFAREQSATPEAMPDYDEGDLCAVIWRAMEAARPEPSDEEERRLVEAYQRGWREGCETLIEDTLYGEPPQMPHKDAMSEGCGQFLADLYTAMRSNHKEKEDATKEGNK